MHTHYDTLKVARDAPPEVIKAAYRALTQRHHPDRNPGDADAVRAMQAINDAYALLSDPDRRRDYDATLAPATPPPATHTHRGATPAARADRARAARSYRQQAAPGRVAAPPPQRRRARWMWLSALGLLVAIPAGLLSRTLLRAETPALIPVDHEMPAWGMRALEPADTVQTRARAAVEQARVRTARVVAAARDTAPLVLPAFPEPVVIDTPPSISPLPPMPTALRVLGDPNGQPWPVIAGYVAGLRQDFTDGLTTVTLDNRGSASAMFVKLVSLDDARMPAVRHVFVPAYQFFTIGSLRPGTYELRYQDLGSGGLNRSAPFRLSQAEEGDVTRYSELDITLYPVSGGGLSTSALASEAF